MARVALLCDTCDGVLDHRCPTCDQRAWDEQAEEQARERKLRDEAHATCLKIPGVEPIETILGVEVRLDYSYDQEAASPHVTAFAEFLGGTETAYGATDAEAVAKLRASLVTSLRALANDLEAV